MATYTTLYTTIHFTPNAAHVQGCVVEIMEETWMAIYTTLYTTIHSTPTPRTSKAVQLRLFAVQLHDVNPFSRKKTHDK